MKLRKTKTCLSLILGLVMTSSVAYANDKVEGKQTETIQNLLKWFDDEICHPFPECILPNDDDANKNGKRGKKRIK